MPLSRQTVLIAMVRNEMGIIEDFMAHALALFDRICIADHQSTDGTTAFLANIAQHHPHVQLLRFEEEGHYQSELTTWMAHQIADSRRDDWVFMLDADEFLPFTSKADFKAALGRLGNARYITLPWLNLVPLEFDKEGVLGRSFFCPTLAIRLPVVEKAAFRSSLLGIASFIVAPGNHSLYFEKKFLTRWLRVVALLFKKWLRRRYHRPVMAFPLYHIPIRTIAQLKEKVEKGVRSLAAKGNERPAGEGHHWDEIRQRLAARECSPELAAGFILYYNDPLNNAREFSHEELRALDYNEMTLDVARVEVPSVSNTSVPETAWIQGSFTANGRAFRVSRYAPEKVSG
jgi:hypothetical protein